MHSRAHLVLALAVLVLTGPSINPASANQTMGGQDIRIDDLAVGGGIQPVDVAVTTDGDIFAVCITDDTNTQMNIYRSEDGGTTWTVWSELGSLGVDGEIWKGQMVTTRATPNAVVLAWIDRVSGTSILRVSSADASSAIPSWSHVTVDSTGGLAMSSPRLAASGALLGANRLALAWKISGEVQYATSATGGTSWSTPLVLESTLQTLTDLDVVPDQVGTVHLSWVNVNHATDVATIRYRKAVNHGESLGDWAATDDIESLAANVFSKYTMAADPAGPGVLIATGGNGQFWLQISTDSGVSWGAATEYSDLTNPDAEWGSTGPFITVSTSGFDGSGPGDAIMFPIFNFAGAWTVEVMNGVFGTSTGQAELAIDESRGGLPLIVYTQETFGDGFIGHDLWFDAAWRDAPGYGAPDPIHPIITDTAPITRAPLAGDLDGDGVQEIVFSEATSLTDHTLRVRDPNNIYDDFTVDDLHPQADFALLDLDRDGDLEVVYYRSDEWLTAVHGDGTTVTGYPKNLGLLGQDLWVSGGRVTGALEEEVVSAGLNAIYLFGPDGVLRPGFPFNAPNPAGLACGRVAIGDVDGDGSIELVAPFTGGVYILDDTGLTVSVIGEGEASPGSPSLADFDDDGDLEIVIPRADGTIHFVHHDGTSISPAWPYDTGATGLPSQVALADLAGDDRRDLVFLAADRMVHLVTPAGNVPTGFPGPVDSTTAMLDPIVAQLGTAGPSIAIGGADGTMHLHEVDGNQEAWPRYQGASVTGSATAMDIDYDGITELMIPTTDVLWILDMGVAEPAEAKLWPISGADVGRSGNADPAVHILSAVDETPVRGAQLHGAAPNPFNPMTHIRFSLPADANHVTLSVYDAAGRRVRMLHQGALSAGDHTVAWRGDDDSGRAVASGVYFSRLESGGQAQTKPMVLLR